MGLVYWSVAASHWACSTTISASSWFIFWVGLKAVNQISSKAQSIADIL